MDMSLATAGLDWARSVDAAMDQRSQAYQAGPATRPICGSRTEILKQLIFSISIMDMSLATAGLDWARSVDAAMDQRSQAYQAGPATRPICGSRTEILKQVRLECVVSLLKAAVAPLSSFIMEALALNHPLTAAIRQQLQLVPSKMVLKNINSMKPTTPFM
ncbi:uncharacterized protein LOC120350757 isoform X3 [Nilaparvata lugens]|uniref:uncharacterized protein LOC120350757 isoform X3 n=1 Tax=Nilaparvata lugens TaxID=108931 RepID=UPI00193D8031|nr:uncharacterized protein LOC120350757 isoform X3 [Nilaparvata lugens]